VAPDATAPAPASAAPEAQSAAESAAPEIRRFGLDRIRWDHFWGIAALHGVCLMAPFTFSWGVLALTAFLYWAICGLGISMGYHRLFTHHGFKTSKPFYYLLAVLGTLNYQSGPVRWVGIHRIHHSESDTDFDPHSPRHGFLWAHLLWCVCHDPLNRDVSMAAKDLRKDPFMMWLDKWHWVPQAALGAVLFAIGGLPWFVWGIGVRVVFTYHATWFVNSASHTWGYKNFATKDDSKNLWWVALISWGEGWHNNHHKYQRSARHGLRWFEVDPTWWTLAFLQKIGVVWDLYSADAPKSRSA
jgi:stearoyl-CoA desaturase (delta-9 desaturase)